MSVLPFLRPFLYLPVCVSTFSYLFVDDPCCWCSNMFCIYALQHLCSTFSFISLFSLRFFFFVLILNSFFLISFFYTSCCCYSCYVIFSMTLMCFLSPPFFAKQPQPQKLFNGDMAHDMLHYFHDFPFLPKNKNKINFSMFSCSLF